MKERFHNELMASRFSPKTKTYLVFKSKIKTLCDSIKIYLV